MYFVTYQEFPYDDLLAFVERVNDRVGREAMLDNNDNDDVWGSFREQFTDHMPCDVDYALEFMVFLAVPSDAIEHIADCAPGVEYQIITRAELIRHVHDSLGQGRAYSLDELAAHLESDDDDDDALMIKCEIADDYEGDLLGDAWRDCRRDLSNFGPQGDNLELHARYVRKHVYRLEERLNLAGQGFDRVKMDVVDFEDGMIKVAIDEDRAIRLTDALLAKYHAEDDEGDRTEEVEGWLDENCPAWRLELNTLGESYFVFRKAPEAVVFRVRWV